MKRRNTRSKEAVMNILSKAGKAMSQDTIEQEIKIEVDRATIYRILNSFCEDGLAHRIVAEDGKQYFAICMRCDKDQMTDNHFHFRCTMCRAIECLPLPVHFSVPKGYIVESVNCILTGTCHDCAAKNNT